MPKVYMSSKVRGFDGIYIFHRDNGCNVRRLSAKAPFFFFLSSNPQKECPAYDAKLLQKSFCAQQRQQCLVTRKKKKNLARMDRLPRTVTTTTTDNFTLGDDSRENIKPLHNTAARPFAFIDVVDGRTHRPDEHAHHDYDERTF